ncbi:MAG: DUF4231 domain-containing protein [Ktedonobacteraceae bacterium]
MTFYRDIWKSYINDKDKEKFCDAIFANLFIFSLSGINNHLNFINEFKERINKSIIDDRTFELAEYLYNVLRFDMSNQFQCTENKYLKSVKEEIKKYKQNESTLKFIHRTLQTILLLGATSLPFILNFSYLQKSIPITISIIVALVAALVNYYKFGSRTTQFQQAAENMQYELNLYQSRRKHYRDLSQGTAFDLFMDNIDELRRKRSELSLELEKSTQEQDQKIDELLRVPAK